MSLSGPISEIIRRVVSDIIPDQFDPTQLPGLQMWLHGDLSPVIFDSGNDISQWNDLSGNNNHATQPFAVSQPSKGTTTLNGKDVIKFDGTNFMNLAAASTFNIDNSDYEIFMVARSSSVAIEFLFSGSVLNYEMHLNLTGEPPPLVGFRFIPITGKFSDIGNNLDFTDGQGHIFGGRVDNNIGIARVDKSDSLDTETPARSSSTGSLFLGQRATGGFRLNGDIAEVLLFSRALSSSERALIENYFNSEWGV